jgi:hypothetical protein
MKDNRYIERENWNMQGSIKHSFPHLVAGQ